MQAGDYQSMSGGVGDRGLPPLPQSIDSSSVTSQPQPDNCCVACCQTCCVGCSDCSRCCSTGICASCCASCAASCPACCSPASCCARKLPLVALLQWLAVLLYWVSVPLLISALAVPDLWRISSINGWWYAPDVRSGAFSLCEFDKCTTQSYRTLVSMTDLDAFQSLRAFGILAVVAAAACAGVSTARMAMLRRGKAVSRRLDLALHVLGAAAVCSSIITVGCAVEVMNSFKGVITINYHDYGQRYRYGVAFGLLNSGFALLTVAAVLHSVSWICAQRKAAAERRQSDAQLAAVLPLEDQQKVSLLYRPNPALFPPSSPATYQPGIGAQQAWTPSPASLPMPSIAAVVPPTVGFGPLTSLHPPYYPPVMIDYRQPQ